MEAHSVCVLMSSYNGEEYIREQIDSILSQEGVAVTLYVRDDGSSDHTLEILDEYLSQGKIVLLDRDKRENLGPAVSFMRMLYRADDTYEYYAFSDQDDVWKPEKLIKGIERIENEERDIPILYCSNQIIYRNGVEEGSRYKDAPNIMLANLICGSPINGCTMIMNRVLKSLLSMDNHRPSEDVLRLRMHDTWAAIIALISGKLVYDDQPYMLYRIHDKNAAGLGVKGIKRLKKFFRTLFNPEIKNGRSRIASEVLLKFEAAGDDFGILNLFARYRESWSNKMALLKCKEIRETCAERRIVFVAKVLANWV